MQAFAADAKADSKIAPKKIFVGAGAKLDRDGSKLDSGDGAKLDFLRRAAEVTGLERVLMED